MQQNEIRSQKGNDNEFVIIGLRPLKGCARKHLKILTPGQLYQFNQNYVIDIANDTAQKKSILPSRFYSERTSININAIVGKNGSGKSSVVELLLKAINNISAHSENITTKLVRISGLNVEIYFHSDKIYKITLLGRQINICNYNLQGQPQKVTSFSDIQLRKLFYTVVINYSHYAYNSTEFGKDSAWLEYLFEKNDGYQVPLSINPKRTKGDININNENHLVKSRLITTLLLPSKDGTFSFKRLTEHYTATFLKLQLNESKESKILYKISDSRRKIIEEVSLKSLDINHSDILKKINKLYPFNYSRIDQGVYKVALDYIVYKVVNIAITYDEYSHFFDQPTKTFTGDIGKYLTDLMSDESHITFKLMQVLNFLKFQHISIDASRIELGELSQDIKTITSRRLKRKPKAIELIPPPIFKVEIVLKNEATDVDNIEFETLSSGQKQMIYSVSSLLYHLINLNSVKRNSKTKTAYRYANVIFEEIELYFHPEMQRTYIMSILEAIMNLRLNNIKGVNMFFITHSPFILSDIPKSNILFLNPEGMPDNEAAEVETFGGNIHKLLSRSFFLGNGLIGEFSRTRIEECIRQLNDNEQKMDEVDLEKTINLIGEPFLKQKLLDKLYEKYNSVRDNSTEIKFLKARLKELEDDTTIQK